MPGWIDTHCHLTDSIYTSDRQQTIRNLTERNVSCCISLGVDTASSFLARNLARCHPGIVYFCAGIHPHEADKESFVAVEAQLYELWQDPRCLAVGEIGLDYFRDYASTEAQQNNFREQLLAAQKIGKPVVIHNRSAETQILSMLDEIEYRGTGIFHCFSGDVAYAAEIVKRGFYASFAGNITYEKSTLLEVAKSVPLDRLLIETDAPWLTPAPNRKQRNEPGNVATTGTFLANALGIDPNQLIAQLEVNFQTLFPIQP